MRIAVPREVVEAEPRVAATPDTVKRFTALGATVVVETGAGVASGIPDGEYEAVGATIAPDAAAAFADADIVLKVRRPSAPKSRF